MKAVSVELTKRAAKDLDNAPEHIQDKFQIWTDSLRRVGLEETRRSKGLHDEALQGDRAGQRSVRLNRSWRAIYKLKSDGSLWLVSILEVTNHEY